jgi:hypothetical protein
LPAIVQIVSQLTHRHFPSEKLLSSIITKTLEKV